MKVIVGHARVFLYTEHTSQLIDTLCRNPGNSTESLPSTPVKQAFDKIKYKKVEHVAN